MPEPAATEPVQPRIVPGAPPPKDVPSKAAAKRRRKKAKGEAGANDDAPPTPVVESAALTPAPPAPVELKPELVVPTITREGSAAPGSAQIANSPLPDEDGVLSPIVELVSKRLKVTKKKHTRFVGYTTMEAEKLNDDQRRGIKDIPGLEAVEKELVEVKKAIEAHEAGLAQGIIAKRLETERAEKARIQSAVDDAQEGLIARTSTLLSLIRLSSAFGTQPFEVSASAVFSDDLERSVIHTLPSTLLGDNLEVKASTLESLLKVDGDYQGVPFARIDEIVQALLNPPTPTPESPIDDRQQSVSAPSISGEDRDASLVTSITGSFHFIQESEIEPEHPQGNEPNYEEAPEWVEKPADEAPPVVEQEVPHANGLDSAEKSVPAVGGGGSTLDWANTEGEDSLPPIESLQPSGSATPGDSATPAEGVNGENEGHRVGGGRHGRGRPHHGHRGGFGGPGGDGEGRRGRGHGHFRGGDRGGFRGGERGGFRGGFRGDGPREPRGDREPREQKEPREPREQREPRGENGEGRPYPREPRGDFRGGFRGFRGGYGPREGADSNWRDGERRGGGRGGHHRGRGYGPRPGAPGTPVSQAPPTPTA